MTLLQSCVPAVCAGLVGALTLAGATAWREEPEPSYALQVPGPAELLAAWADFPAGAGPRPVVLLEWSFVRRPSFEPSSEADFVSEEVEAGYYHRRWRLPAALPSAPPRMDGFAVLPAAEAIAALRRDAAAEQWPDQPAATLTITRMRLGRAEFETDRGRQPLPAWFVRFTRAGVAVVPAVAPPDLYVPREPQGDYGDGTVVAVGDRLSYTFRGRASGRGPCHAEYEARARESASAVLLEVVTHPWPDPHVGTMRTWGYLCATETERTVRVRLARPLGNRVVLGHDFGQAITTVPLPPSP